MESGAEDVGARLAGGADAGLVQRLYCVVPLLFDTISII